MKRFVLNKIKIAKLVKLQEIKGGGVTPNTDSVDLQGCVTNDCVTANLMSCAGVMPCTNTSDEGHEVTDPLGTGTDSQ